MAILYARNNALSVHPPQGDQYLTTNGSDWLFTVAAVFGFSVVCTLLLSHPSLTVV